MTEPRIRRGERRDIPELTAIYNHYVENAAATFDIEPYTVEQRECDWFSKYHESGPYQLFVAADDEAVLGFATSSSLRPKSAYITSVEMTVYCTPESTQRGLGRRLYAALLGSLANEDVHRAYAGITLPNEPSIKLHERFGFVHLGTYREVGRKFGKFWDVAWFEKEL